MKILATLLLTLYLGNDCCAQNVLEQSLLKRLETEKNNFIRGTIYASLYEAVFSTNLDKSREYAEKLLETANKSGSFLLFQSGYMGLAGIERKKKNYEAVYPMDLHALEYAKKTKIPQNIFSANLDLARDYLDGDKQVNALQYLNDNKVLEQGIKDRSMLAKQIQTFALYYQKTNENVKALPYFKKALQSYQELNNERMVAETKSSTAISFLDLREFDSASTYLYQAMDIFRKRGLVVRQAECYGFLGQCYKMNGNIDKAIESYLKAVELFKLSQNPVQEALASCDLASFYLSKNDSTLAKSFGARAQGLLTLAGYEYGIIMNKTFWGTYYSATGENAKAEAYFKEADKMAVANALLALKADNERYWAAHLYKVKDKKTGDSLAYSYAEHIAATREAISINRDFEAVLKKNPTLDKASLKKLRMLYSPGGADSIRRQFGNKSLAEILRIDSLLNLDPHSLATSTYDSSVAVNDNKLLIEQETRFKTRIIADSLNIAQQNALIAKQDIQRRNTILVATFVGLLLLGGGLYLQYKSRKRAEYDKAKIELLQNEIHHRVRNNLGVIRRLIDVAGKTPSDQVSLQSLQSRVTAIELLHKRLYNDKITGNISLQEYLAELTGAIQEAFETDKKIDISINTPVTVSSKAAEKIGLITNELVTNSYKYAFEGRNSGTISIDAQPGSNNQYQLTIADNGKGMELAAIKNYGMKLIAGLSHELGGKFSFAIANGTRFTLQFDDTNN